MGGYDLYGNYYSSSRDALNAEMAQCADIDLGLAKQKIQQQEVNQHCFEEEIRMRLDVIEAALKLPKFGSQDWQILFENLTKQP